MDKKRAILVIDDEIMLLDLLKKMLEPQYEIGIANSASSAISFLNNNKVDLILLDITMPNITGFDFLLDIRKIPSYMDVPIIIVSGNTGQEFFTQARNSTAFDVLTKPVKKELLVKTIEKALSGQGL